jgi:hypothetical protein
MRQRICTVAQSNDHADTSALWQRPSLTPPSADISSITSCSLSYKACFKVFNFQSCAQCSTAYSGPIRTIMRTSLSCTALASHYLAYLCRVSYTYAWPALHPSSLRCHASSAGSLSAVQLVVSFSLQRSSDSAEARGRYKALLLV